MAADERSAAPGYPAWAPRFWHSMVISDWFRLLARNRFRIHPLRWGLASTVTLVTPFNTKMRLVQTAVYGHRVAHTEITEDPVFIVGHWRSGTTYLHELISRDDRFATPTTYQCFAANHFLVTEPWITRAFWYLIPARRPMDNVVAGWHEPQEDEFALCAMGVPSPYLRMAFPNHGDEYLDYLDMEGLSDREVARWCGALDRFIRSVTLLRQKRLVLKSPTHTGRIRLLARIFPGAQFIHIVRDPYTVVPSTLRLWQSLDEAQGLQRPRHDQLESYVFRAYERMYGGFQRGRGELDPRRICEIRYEDLVRDPCGTLRTVYDQLGLGDFEALRPDLEAALAQKEGYQTNRYQPCPRLDAEVASRWSDYIGRYGYRGPGRSPG
jgi:hypothetical protein